MKVKSLLVSITLAGLCFAKSRSDAVAIELHLGIGDLWILIWGTNVDLYGPMMLLGTRAMSFVISSIVPLCLCAVAVSRRLLHNSSWIYIVCVYSVVSLYLIISTLVTLVDAPNIHKAAVFCSNVGTAVVLLLLLRFFSGQGGKGKAE